MQREELERIMEAYGRDLFSFCCFVTRDRQDAEKLYQDTFLKLYESREKLHIDKNAKSFLMSVALNLYRNYRRKRSVRERIAGTAYSAEESWREVPDERENVEERALAGEACRALREAVRRLPDKYRLPVLLYYMENLTQREIARLMGLPEETVKTRLRRARAILRKDMEGQGYERSYG